jgi:hypothetical protein
MNILKALRAEESKFRQQLETVRAAIAIYKNGSKATGKRKRSVSRAARAKMARAQRARWRRIRAAKRAR